ncbi:MAG: phosphomannomutase/phosphoglucomutase [Patescibacteria group bacterium]
MTSVNSKIFKAYDIRGIYPEEINEGAAYQIGRAFALYLKKFESPMPEKIIVGQDARLSSQALSNSFKRGVTDEGVHVLDIGLVPVDVVYFASGSMKFPAAMVTASHNPKDWNGFKLIKSNVEFFNVLDLEIIIKNLPPKIPDVIKGEIKNENIKELYIKHVLSFIDIQNIRPMRIAIDTGNGAVGPILKSILQKLPIEYIAMNFNPDGDFPNHEPDPSKEKNNIDLINEINGGHYHFGCAFDGDGDRIIFIDEEGKPINPSIIGAIIAKSFLKPRHYGKVVYSLDVSKIVPDVVNAYGGEPIRERVGHTYIKKRLKEVDGILGIENSGHYYFKNNFYVDSGIICFLIMIYILSGQKKSLQAISGEFSKYFSISDINFSTKGGSASGGKVENAEALIKKIAQNFEGYQIDWLDGLTITTSDFWFTIRSSNTEPLLRLNIEAKDEIILERVKKDLITLIKKDI